MALFFSQLNAKAVHAVKGHFHAGKKAHHQKRNNKPNNGVDSYHWGKDKEDGENEVKVKVKVKV